MTDSTTTQLRIWPAWIIVFVQWGLILFQVQGEYNNFIRFVAMMAGPLLCLLGYVVWWLFFSRLQGRERWLTPLIAIVAAVIVTCFAKDKVGTAIWIYGIPLTLTILTLWLTLTSNHLQYHFQTTAILAVCSWLWLLAIRIEGFDGSYLPELHWRWTLSDEQILQLKDQLNPTAVTPTKLAVTADYILQANDWPYFRGATRNSTVNDVKLAADWKSSAPKLLWKQAIGPGWGSMTIVNNVLFTQEQRGDNELVIAYDATNGAELWRHADQSRFDEVVAGTGPRATPTFDNGRVYTYGSKAMVNCLDAATGQVIWQRDLLKDYSLGIPMWAYATSPVVVAGQVVLYMDLPATADQTGDAASLIALDVQTGKTNWQVSITGQNYSSVEPITIGTETVLLFGTDKVLLTINPTDGKILNNEPIPAPPGIPAMVQPQALPNGELLISIGDGQGLALLEQTGTSTAPTWKQRWVSRKLKPSFNDYVVYQDYVYGFDQNIIACLDVKTGEQKWKRGRYGFGQMLLFPASSHLVILSEAGELVLVAAEPSGHRELGKFNAISGKTWNHPAWANGRLYVRNGAEIACIELPLAQ